jgi:hypothetical protein
LIARVSHNSGHYVSDNALVLAAIQKAVRGTQYNVSVDPYKKKLDGRGAFEALNRQYPGKAVWMAELKKAEMVVRTQKWKGQTTSFSLERYVSRHRAAYQKLEECSGHVRYQLPNAHSRVTYLLDGIECSDSTLQVVIAVLRKDTAPDGKMNDFELAAAFLLPNDPIAKRRKITHCGYQDDVRR